jgi:anaerobic selenocysteine-containing dehydrogenase
VPTPYIEINRADARRLGIENKATVEVKSGRTSTQVRAKVGRSVKEGTVWMPWRLWDVQVNRMIEPGAPFTAVTLTKVADAPKKAWNRRCILMRRESAKVARRFDARFDSRNTGNGCRTGLIVCSYRAGGY